MVGGKLELVKQKSCSVRTALHKMWGLVVMDPVSYVVLPGEDDVVILGSPILATLGINGYDNLRECARKRNFSFQRVESPNFEEYGWVSITVAALLQRGAVG